MKICAKEDCSNSIPRYHITEDGKKHNTQRRKYCFECSPFGEHNTRRIARKEDGYGSGTCPICGGVSQHKNSKCFKCYFYEREKKISQRVYNLIGYDCWFCGYDKGEKAKGVLDFHHVFPENKLFCLTTRELVGHSWDRVWEEMQKCVSLCCRCHRELHADIIEQKDIYKIYKDKWEQIRKELGNNWEDFGEPIRKIYPKTICPVCEKEFENRLQNECCSLKCKGIKSRKPNRPSKEQLLEELKESNFCALGRKYGVSDNAIRKWLK